MIDTPPDRVVVLVGAGLSAASGVPTFRDADGLWEGYDVTQVATPEAWDRDPPLVRRFYDERRSACTQVEPNPGHTALARLQRSWGVDRMLLVSQNIDALLSKAGALEVLDMHGSLWRLRCEHDEQHPVVPVHGDQDPDARCTCGGRLRPDVVWFGEMPRFMARIGQALSACDTFLAVGTSGVVYPAAGFGEVARREGAHTVELNPQPSGSPWFQTVIAEGSETALPRIVSGWLHD